jgi:hypothetical protein
MKIFHKNISLTGLISAAVFLFFSVFIFSYNTDGQGGALKLFLAFPWFLIAMDKIPLWPGILINTGISYLIGYGIERSAKNLIETMRKNKRKKYDYR